MVLEKRVGEGEGDNSSHCSALWAFLGDVTAYLQMLAPPPIRRPLLHSIHSVEVRIDFELSMNRGCELKLINHPTNCCIGYGVSDTANLLTSFNEPDDNTVEIADLLTLPR